MSPAVPISGSPEALHPRTILRVDVEQTQDDASTLHVVLATAHGQTFALRLPLEKAKPLARRLSALARK
jgi:hypothetical protein